MKHVRVEEIPDSDSNVEVNETNELRNGWLIISPTKTFAVYAQTAMEKQEWMTHMNRCIEEERRKAGRLCMPCNLHLLVLSIVLVCTV